MLGKANVDHRAKYRAATRLEILQAAWDVAREQGLAAVTLREVAARVGMQAPSLYSHFDSKNAIYDAMFGQAWQEYSEVVAALSLPDSPRAALRLMAPALDANYRACATAHRPLDGPAGAEPQAA